ncbi:MAG: homocysteine S-methyltransferase family protein [Myxococcota bacterium]|nr:homocysteine S-methyltransferase family protein [Myxococcota bacterium]
MDKQAIARDLASRTFLTFGGNETFLLFVQQYPLREFCAFEVVGDETAWSRLENDLQRPIFDAAASNGHGVITDSLVWRASRDYVERLGYKDVAAVNHQAIARTRRMINEWKASSSHAATPIILAADVGPRGDGYAAQTLSPEVARVYHAAQVDALAAAGADLVVALTMTNVPETIGLVQAATRAGLPVLVSPTVETDGTVPDGSTLGDFVAAVDDATGGDPVAYMANCAHPIHIEATLRAAADRGESWLPRFRGLRANASTKTHVELDNSTELDRGQPDDLARRMADLKRSFGFTIVGGCCGTDADHLTRIAHACR